VGHDQDERQQMTAALPSLCRHAQAVTPSLDLIFVSNFDIFSKPSVFHDYSFTAGIETGVKES
jgi:hypothetical protein